MNKIRVLWCLLVLTWAACSGDSNVEPVLPTSIEPFGGNDQSGTVGAALLDSLRVLVTDAEGNGTPGVSVTWSVVIGGGATSPATTTTNSSGVASTQFTMGPNEGDQQAQAEVSGLAGSPVLFTAHSHIQPLVATNIEPVGGTGLSGAVNAPLRDSLRVRVTDASGLAVPNVAVNWSVLTEGGAVSPASSTTNGSGVASAQFTLGSVSGQQQAQAEVSGLADPPVVFTATAIVLSTAGGGNNVPERYSSDLWVHGNYAYTGTWSFRDEQGIDVGNQLKIWSLDVSGAPALVNAIDVGDVINVSDVQVSEDGQLLMFSAEFGSDAGLYLYSLANPADPTFLGRALVSNGLHTATLAEIGGHRYTFAASSPGGPPALFIYDIGDPAHIAKIATIQVPPHYGVHDSFVRDGLAFVFAWEEGVIIYDVGNGMRGGSPSAPVEVSRLKTSKGGVGSRAVHNGWWFHNPVTGESRYLFIGQEGPAEFGAISSGDIHVVDVSDLAHPLEVASFHLDGAGTHNFWIDEGRQVLYAAYYNAGVIALDISGELKGDLSERLLSQIQPGGPGNTFTWGVQLANGFLYAIDMLSGLWQLRTE